MGLFKEKKAESYYKYMQDAWDKQIYPLAKKCMDYSYISMEKEIAVNLDYFNAHSEEYMKKRRIYGGCMNYIEPMIVALHGANLKRDIRQTLVCIAFTYSSLVDELEPLDNLDRDDLREEEIEQRDYLVKVLTLCQALHEVLDYYRYE